MSEVNLRIWIFRNINNAMSNQVFPLTWDNTWDYVSKHNEMSNRARHFISCKLKDSFSRQHTSCKRHLSAYFLKKFNINNYYCYYYYYYCKACECLNLILLIFLIK